MSHGYRQFYNKHKNRRCDTQTWQKKLNQDLIQTDRNQKKKKKKIGKLIRLMKTELIEK